MIAPAPDATFPEFGNIRIGALTTDPDGTIARVDFYQGTKLLGSASTPPYAITWTNVPVGSYTLTARATDNRRAVTTSAAVGITVAAVGNTPPAVSLTSPSAGQTFAEPGVILLRANASDSDGTVSKVDFYTDHGHKVLDFLLGNRP